MLHCGCVFFCADQLSPVLKGSPFPAGGQQSLKCQHHFFLTNHPFIPHRSSPCITSSLPPNSTKRDHRTNDSPSPTGTNDPTLRSLHPKTPPRTLPRTLSLTSIAVHPSPIFCFRHWLSGTTLVSMQTGPPIPDSRVIPVIFIFCDCHTL